MINQKTMMEKLKSFSVLLIIVFIINSNIASACASVKQKQTTGQCATVSSVAIVNSYTVTLPKFVKLDRYTKTSDYLVTVRGSLTANANIMIVPDTVFMMKSVGKDNVEAHVPQEKTIFTSTELSEGNKKGISAVGMIEANGLSAGMWTGTFTFEVSCDEAYEELILTRENMANYVNAETDSAIVTTGDVIIPAIVKDKASGKKYQVTGLEGNLSSKKSIFSNPLSITSVTLPNTLKRVGEAAFCNCKNLTNINDIPNDITDIDGSAFYGTQWLKNKQNENKDDNSLVYFNNMLIDGSAASGDVKLADGIDKICPHAFYENKNESHVIVPESITCIGDHAFDKFNGLKSVTLPESITGIGDYAFFNCGKLTSITITDNTDYIGANAFNNCRGLKEVIISDSVNTIGSYAFNNCGSLSSIRIPDSVTQINTGTFYNCGNLRSIIMHENITIIDDFAFNNCRNLTSIAIPNGIRSINTAVFAGCTKIKSIKYKDSAFVSKSVLLQALSDNDVVFESDVFDATALSD